MQKPLKRGWWLGEGLGANGPFQRRESSGICAANRGERHWLQGLEVSKVQTKNPCFRIERENLMRPALLGKMIVDPVLVEYRSMLHWSPHCLKGYEATANSAHN